jgi:hypothetical protein
MRKGHDMLHSIKQLRGTKLGASDGVISYEESTVFVALPGESLEPRSVHLPATAVTAP